MFAAVIGLWFAVLVAMEVTGASWRPADQVPFSAADWRKHDGSFDDESLVRLRMITDLCETHLRVGTSRASVLERLGDPETQLDSKRWHYGLGLSRATGRRLHSLDIEFDAGGFIESVRVYGRSD